MAFVIKSAVFMPLHSEHLNIITCPRREGGSSEERTIPSLTRVIGVSQFSQSGFSQSGGLFKNFSLKLNKSSIYLTT